MKNILIVGNWKMNPESLAEARIIFDGLFKDIKKEKNKEIVLCPPFIYLCEGLAIKQSKVKFGAQDCFWHQKGAYTGEISPLMLKNIRCEYVIIGHSERRRYFGETNEIINEKIKSALKIGLKPILCIGENESERENLSVVLENQLINSLTGLSTGQITRINIAYEPVWAIGTDNPCLPDDAMAAYLLIKKILLKTGSRAVVDRVKVLYGGSIKLYNAVDYIKKAGMDGLLVGGASINVSEFLKIVESINIS